MFFSKTCIDTGNSKKRKSVPASPYRSVHAGEIQVWSRRKNKQSGLGKENGQHPEKVSWSVIWYDFKLCYAMSRYATLCHVMLCYGHCLCPPLIIDSIISYFLLVLFHGWMENPKTYQGLQLTSLRMCLCNKAQKGKKSSSTSEDSIR